jgi:hypothetical protein
VETSSPQRPADRPGEKDDVMRDSASKIVDPLVLADSGIGQVDLRKLPACSEWPNVIDGLRHTQNELEVFLAPYVTRKRTTCVMEYKGKIQYLKCPLPLVAFAVAGSLAYLYRALAAHKANDTDELMRTLIAFSKYDLEVWALAKHRVSSLEAINSRDRKREIGRTEATNTNRKRIAKRPDYSNEILALLARGMKYTPACKRVAALHDVTWQTVRNNTPELRPKNLVKKR